MDETTTSIISLSGGGSGASGSPGSAAPFVSLPQMSSPSASHDASGQQQQQQQLKKLYFKPSSTEGLHSAILLKARNPNSSSSSSSSSAVTPMPALNSNNNNTWKSAGGVANSENNASKVSLYPKLTTVNNLLSISSSSSSEAHPSAQPTSNANMYGDELDSPLKIKENILASIRNLKPVLAGLDPLRSSTSDDEDSHLETLERKKIQVTVDSNNEASMSEIVILGSTNGSASSTGLPSVVAQPALQVKQAPRQTYLRTNSTSSSNYPTNRINSLTVTTTTTIVRSTSNLAQLKRLCSKRGKEEALSNSSSSDEEDQQKKAGPPHPHQQQQHKLQQLILNTPAPASPLKLTFNKSNTNNLLTVNNMLTTTTQPPITPVVSANAAAASACSSLASSIAIPACNNSAGSVNESVSSSFNASEIGVTSPSSTSSSSPSFSSSSSSSSSSTSSSPYLKSQKSSIDQDYDSKYPSSYSAASPTSICSSSATNDGTIDLQDDNSSTASGPIYVRQPGFEHHAHEVVLTTGHSTTTTPKIRNFCNLEQRDERITRVKKSDSVSALLAGAGGQADKKAKKKLCLMTTTTTTMATDDMSSSLIPPDRHNVHLKPLSSKAKREGLPMRLRALPPSFWQQPNQPSALPGAMYLPPLFKSDLDAIEDDSSKILGFETSAAHREVKISPANTDLLFKLFESAEKKQQQQLSHQRSLKKPSKAALTKDEDPCIVDAVSEGLFPLLSLDGTRSNSNETVQYLAFRANELPPATATLSSNGLSTSSPMISSTSSTASALFNCDGHQNYSQALSEIVAAL